MDYRNAGKLGAIGFNDIFDLIRLKTAGDQKFEKPGR